MLINSIDFYCRSTDKGAALGTRGKRWRITSSKSTAPHQIAHFLCRARWKEEGGREEGRRKKRNLCNVIKLICIHTHTHTHTHILATIKPQNSNNLTYLSWPVCFALIISTLQSGIIALSVHVIRIVYISELAIIISFFFFPETVSIVLCQIIL